MEIPPKTYDLNSEISYGINSARNTKAKDILEAMTHTVPLAQLMDGQIAALRHWAKGRAREAASHTTSGPRTGRRISQAN